MNPFTTRLPKPSLLLLMALPLLLCFCKKNKAGDLAGEADTFDKQGLLTNMADQVILANYTTFATSLDSLELTFAAFKASLAPADFQAAKQRLHVAYLNYQYISLYEFGPAAQELLTMNFNIFPTDTAQIAANCASGSYNLADLANHDAKGFPALDFLLNDFNRSEALIIQAFSQSPKRQQYASDLITAMKAHLSTVRTGWNTAYKTQFVNSLGTDIGSSIGFLVNQVNYELDYLKNAKLGIPLGKKTLGIALPNSCEGFYGQRSLEYAMATLTGIENIYLGKSRAGVDGKGFDDYLDHLKASYGGGSLNAAIKDQFALTRTKLNAIGGVLSTQVINNPATVNAAYTELTKLLVLLKTDMPSALGVVITYQDGDGD